MFEVSSSLCPPQADISVSAFATNIFGDGQHSDGVHIGKQLTLAAKRRRRVTAITWAIFVRPSIRPSVRLSVCPSVRLSITTLTLISGNGSSHNHVNIQINHE